MEEGSESTRYWCHECSRTVETVMDSEMIKCSLCHGGFVEEMDRATPNHHNQNHAGDSESDRALSSWAPVLLGMVSNPRRRRRFRHVDNDGNEDGEGGVSELGRRRRRSSATILQLLHGIRAGIVTASESISGGGNNRLRDRDRERVMLINPFNHQTIIVQGGGGGNLINSGRTPQNHLIRSLGDYFVGPGLELLLQHLTENDPNRYGTPPTQKEVVEAMPTVTIKEDSGQCSVCLEYFEVGNEAKEMPCKHRFHGGCISPWLDLHSSCPVCRYQMPSNDSKLEREQESSRAIANGPNNRNGENSSRLSFAFPWSFSSLFSSTPITNPNLIMSPSTQSGSGSGSQQRVSEETEGEGEDDH